MPAKPSESVPIGGDNDTVANDFNNHFANVASSFVFEEDNTNNIHTESNHKPSNDKSLKLSPVTEMDVLKEIFALKTYKIYWY